MGIDYQYHKHNDTRIISDLFLTALGERVLCSTKARRLRPCWVLDASCLSHMWRNTSTTDTRRIRQILHRRLDCKAIVRGSRSRGHCLPSHVILHCQQTAATTTNDQKNMLRNGRMDGRSANVMSTRSLTNWCPGMAQVVIRHMYI